MLQLDDDMVSQRCKHGWKSLSFVLKSCIHPLVINPLVGLEQSSLGQPVYSPDQHQAPDLECVNQGCRNVTSGQFILWQMSVRWPSSATPSPYLVAHCSIDNSHSMNGKTRKGKSHTDICACCPYTEGSGEGRETMSAFLFIFSKLINHYDITITNTTVTVVGLLLWIIATVWHSYI